MRIPELLRPLLLLLFTAGCTAALFRFVDLTPRIDENFFFSTDDPQFQDSLRLERMFKLPPQIFMTAEGNIRSRAYLDRISLLTQDLQEIKGVKSVFSLGAGPGSVEDAVESPLWSRFLIAWDARDNERGSNLVLALEKSPEYGPIVEKINELKARYDAPGFDLSITGTPYVVHEIQKRLIQDMRNFTLAAAIVFSLVIAVIYRSGWILLGAIHCAWTAAVLDFLALKLLGVDPGPLGANLWTIAFILTLSHVVFISGNWERLARAGTVALRELPQAAARETGVASFWSMITNSLGFATLLFTAARPIRQFGLAGLVGSILAMAVAYSIFPTYLRLVRGPARPERSVGPIASIRARMKPRYGIPAALVAALGLAVSTGGGRIVTQPPIFAYFDEESGLRQDLTRIDRLGGSSPLYLAVRSSRGGTLMNEKEYIRLWELQLALEEHPRVGEVVSLPAVLGEFVNSPLAPLLSWELIYAILDLPLLGEPGRSLVTEDRRTALYLLRMQESELGGALREEVVEDLLGVVRRMGFDPVLTGGLFRLTGELSTLVSRSLLQGVTGLAGMLFLIALLVSRSLRVAIAVVLSLVLVPLTVLGAAGYLKIPLEIIATPGINLAMGLGVDEMIHLVHHAKMSATGSDFESARRELRKPISTSCLMLGLGFSVFSLSNFPPTRNMGWLVVIGSAMALAVMLLVFPILATRIFGTAAPGRRSKPAPPAEKSGKAA